MSDDFAALPRQILHEVTDAIDRHMRGGRVFANGDALDWAFTVQRATRLYLFQLKVPEAEPWWGRWRGKPMGQTWGSLKGDGA